MDLVKGPRPSLSRLDLISVQVKIPSRVSCHNAPASGILSLRARRSKRPHAERDYFVFDLYYRRYTSPLFTSHYHLHVWTVLYLFFADVRDRLFTCFQPPKHSPDMYPVFFPPRFLASL